METLVDIERALATVTLRIMGERTSRPDPGPERDLLLGELMQTLKKLWPDEMAEASICTVFVPTGDGWGVQAAFDDQRAQRRASAVSEPVNS